MLMHLLLHFLQHKSVDIPKLGGVFDFTIAEKKTLLSNEK